MTQKKLTSCVVYVLALDKNALAYSMMMLTLYNMTELYERLPIGLGTNHSQDSTFFNEYHLGNNNPD